MKPDLIYYVKTILEDYGFSAVECTGSRSCFDILAKKGNSMVLIKTLANIEGFNKVVAHELKSTACALNAIPLVVGSHMKSHMLDDNVVYDRYGLMVVNPDTLGSLLEGRLPGIQAKRGKYCVHVDKDKLVGLREKKRLTQNDLAELLGVTSHSVYRYEKTGRMSYDIFQKLNEVFSNVSIQSDMLGEMPEYDIDEVFQRHLTQIKRDVKNEFDDMGFDAFFTNAPFDLLATQKKSVFTVVSNDWRRIEKKLEMVEEISDLLGGYSVCVTNRKVKSESIVFSLKELKDIKDTKDFYYKLRENK